MAKESDLEFVDKVGANQGEKSSIDQSKDVPTPYGGSGAHPSFSSALMPRPVSEAQDSSTTKEHQQTQTAPPRTFHDLDKLTDGNEVAKEPREEGMKEVGMEDLDKKLQEIIEKSYHNSLLMMDNFEKMKVDFKMMRNEIVEEVQTKETLFRQEVRESLMQQLSFIEEQMLGQKQEIERMKSRVNNQDVKIESFTQIMQSVNVASEQL